MMFPNPVRRSFLPSLTRSASRPVPMGLRDHAASALATAVTELRQQAIADGVRPLPGVVHRALLGYFPEALLRRCRFAISEHGPLKLPALRLSYGDASAVTVGDVVLFRSERMAQSDPEAWAHQLTHVMQYQRWGTEEFARRFVQDAAAIEQEAAMNASRFLAWSRNKPGLARA